MKPLATVVLSLFAVSMVYAQDAPPWPPDPTAIFADGVEVIRVTFEKPPPPVEESPLATIPLEEFPSPLPDGYTWDNWTLPAILPDGKTVILLGKANGDKTSTAYVFTYNVAAKQFHSLDKIIIEDTINVTEFPSRRWIDNHIFLMNMENYDTPSNHSTVIVDVSDNYMYQTEPGEITHLVDDPLRIETFFEGTDDLDNRKCRGSIYDLRSRNTIYYEYGNLCGFEFGDPFGVGYYRVVSADGKQASIIQFNPVTQDRKELYVGEVEHVSWVSDDKHYAAFVLDNNGTIDLESSSSNYWVILSGARLALIDLESKNTLFDTPAYMDELFNDWRPFVSQIAPGYIQVFPSANYSPGYLMRIESNRVTSWSFYGILSRYLGNDWAVRHMQYDGEYGTFEKALGLYNLKTRRPIPILDVSQYPYVILINEFKRLDTDTFQVSVQYYDLFDNEPPNGSTAHYVIRILNMNNSALS